MYFTARLGQQNITFDLILFYMYMYVYIALVVALLHETLIYTECIHVVITPEY